MEERCYRGKRWADAESMSVMILTESLSCEKTKMLFSYAECRASRGPFLCRDAKQQRKPDRRAVEKRERIWKNGALSKRNLGIDLLNDKTKVSNRNQRPRTPVLLGLRI